MMSFLLRMLQFMARSMRHTILNYANEVPTLIQVYPGEKGTLYRSIVTHLIDAYPTPQLDIVETPERSRPVIWIDDETPVAGCMTVCRYIGRQRGLLPIDPMACALVDSSLELLQSFLYPFMADTFTESMQMCDHIAVFAAILDDTLTDETDGTMHTSGFDEWDTLADVCWVATWKHVIDMEGVDIHVADFPNLVAWMKYHCILREDYQTEEEDSKTEEEDPDAEPDYSKTEEEDPDAEPEEGGKKHQ
jgi:glutathione S-transferase